MKLSKKAILTVIGTISVIAACAFGIYTTKQVNADNGVVLGGRASGGGAAGWAWAESDATQLPTESKAYKAFYNAAENRNNEMRYYPSTNAYIDANVSSSVKNLCRTSQYIWWYGDRTYWYSWRGNKTAGDEWFKGAPGTPGLLTWVKRQPGWGGAGDPGSNPIVVVCSNSAPGFLPPRITYKDVPQTDGGAEKYSKTISGVYSSQTKVVPEMVTGLNSSETDKWISTHYTQQYSVIGMNDWSRYIDSLGSLSIKAGDNNIESKLNAIEEKSNQLKSGDYVAHPKVDLSAENKKAFSKGGVFTINEYHNTKTVTYSGRQGWSRSRTCKQKYVNGKASGAPECPAWGPKRYNATTIKFENPAADSFSLYSFWQMINVRCNASGLDKVKANVPGFVEDSYANGEGSSSGHTKTYYTKDTNIADRPLGNPGQSNSVLLNTSKREFFEGTGSCDGNGTDIVPPDNDYALDCSSANQTKGTNDSYNNKRKNGVPTVKGKAGNANYGAQATKGTSNTVTSSDAFSFYRDNEQNKVRLDLWYPVADATKTGVTANGDKRPYLTRMLLITAANSNGAFPDGTPTGAKFGIRLNENDSDVINGVGDNTVQEKDLNNEQTSLWTHANWTSDNDTTEVKNGKEIDTKQNKAQKLNADWSYTPTVKNYVLGTVSGNGADAHPTKTVTESDIIATCAIRMNTTDNTNDNLSVVNSLFDVGRGSLTKADARDNHYLKIAFVRATGDAQ